MNHTLTRRKMLGTVAMAGAACFHVPRLLADTLKESQAKYAGYRMGLQSFSLRAFDAQTALGIMKDLEIHYVEFYKKHFSPDSTHEQIAAMAKLLKKYKVKHAAHGVNRFTSHHETNRKLFVFAKAAGIKSISAMPSPEAFDSLDKLLVEFPDQRISIHNHGPGHAFDKISDVEKALKGRHPHLGACADLGHFIRSGEDPVEVLTRLKGRVFGIHLKDFASTDADAGGKHAPDAILGEGLMDLVAVFKAMKKTKFPKDGAVSLEYEGEKEAPVPNIKKCFEAAAEAAKKVG